MLPGLLSHSLGDRSFTNAYNYQIKSLLAHAQQCANQVGANVSFKRPDRAFVEHVIGSELVLHVIPKHKDYPSVVSGRDELLQKYRLLCKVSVYKLELLRRD